MKVILGIERWCIYPETMEEFVILQDYMERLPKVTAHFDTTNDIIGRPLIIQGRDVTVQGLIESPFLMLDFDPDENLGKT